MNLYAYVGGDPVNLVDPEGLWYAAPIQWGFRGLALLFGAKAAKDTSDALRDSPTEQSEECNGCSDYQRIYEENPKHGFHRRKNNKGQWVSRRPTNGEYALMISVPSGPKRRVAFDDRSHEVVILPEHRTDEQNCIKYYHGYVADYMSDLRGRNDLRNTIRDNHWPLPPKK